MRRATVLVTGCAGMIGANFTRYLINEGYRVIGFDDLSGGYADYLPQLNEMPSLNSFEFWPIDLSLPSSAKDLEDAVTSNSSKPIACFHFAAYAAEGLSPFIRHYNYNNNILSSMNVINLCIEHDIKLIFTSSMAVYGEEEAPFFEDMAPRPIDPYGVAKYAVELDMQIAGKQHGLRYNILRPHNVVGIYQNIWDRYRNVVGIFIRKAIDNEPLLIYGDGNQTRAFSDVKFCLEPFEKLMLSDTYNGEIFNIGSDKDWTINELAEVVRAVASDLGIKVDIEHVEARHEAYNAYCDHCKAEEWLGLEDDTDLEELVRQMFTWALHQPKRLVKKMNYEVVKGMYEYWK
jgi:UDP-glucose 4-epimerase